MSEDDSYQFPTVDNTVEERHAPTEADVTGPRCAYCGADWKLHPDTIRAEFEENGQVVRFFVQGPERWKFRDSGRMALWLKALGHGHRLRRSV